ncbi:hypothetical protein Tco_0622624 [Tanacetum coccineum]
MKLVDTRSVPSLKNSSYQRPKEDPIPVCDGNVVSDEDKIFVFGAGSGCHILSLSSLGNEAEVSLAYRTWDDRLLCFEYSAVCDCFWPKCIKGKFRSDKHRPIEQLNEECSCLSTTPFMFSVRGRSLINSFSLKNALSVLFKNSVPLSVRTEIIGLEISFVQNQEIGEIVCPKERYQVFSTTNDSSDTFRHLAWVHQVNKNRMCCTIECEVEDDGEPHDHWF